MTLAEQFDIQLSRATMMVEKCGYPTLTLVKVTYPDSTPRVSILGGSIVNGMAEVWESQGATVRVLDKIPSMSRAT